MNFQFKQFPQDVGALLPLLYSSVAFDHKRFTFGASTVIMSRLTNVILISGLTTGMALLAQGPGPRPGPGNNNAGQPVPGLNATEVAWFNEAKSRFTEIDSVSGTQPGAPGSGLGPRFNGNSCAQCHAQPAIGGSSPRLNPQIALATNFGARNTVPQFLQQNGPVRVARFVRNPDGSPDGGVHALFVITGRSDAGNCRISQPDFAAAANQRNLSLRIPTPVFGAGFIEAIEDATILDNLAATQQQRTQLGIAGHVNRNGNDGTITRFGWKAQNKSLMMFAREAYNVEQGVTNELFPNERDESDGCVANGTPEDHTNLTATTPQASMSDLVGLALFMRYLDAPQPATQNDPSVQRGSQAFASIGCALCHTAVLQTGPSSVPGLSLRSVRLYSDLAVHNMGAGLADGVSQGLARGNDWRTAPLWGLGSRLFFLHDGRTSDLGTAIAAHASNGSEANQVVANYNGLSAQAKQDVLAFLSSL